MDKKNIYSDQMIEKMPFGVYIIDREHNISYYNQAFSEIFYPGVHQTNVYFGLLARCKYCTTDGTSDSNNPICSNCLIIKQHESAFSSGLPSQSQEIVQEFEINGKKELKYIKIQSIPLDDNHLMVLLTDLTNEAKKLVNLED